MITRKQYNSSGKLVGTIEIKQDKITLKTNSKLDYIIDNFEIVEFAKNPSYNKDILIELYDRYTLTIPEIAAICNVLYHRANKWLKEIFIKLDKRGRRNSSYNQKFTESRKANLSKSIKNYYNNGGKPTNYIRTDEIKNKIRLGVKKAISEGRLNESENARKGWLNNKYQNSDFKRGIAGTFKSNKLNKRIYFGSLLELYYMIFYLEPTEEIKLYSYETIKINCDDGSIYAPDLLINNKDLVELKCYEWIYRVGQKKPEIIEKFNYKVEQATKYCLNNNLNYKVIFDKDLNYKSDRFIQQIKNSDLVKTYEIKFNDPSRIWS